MGLSLVREVFWPNLKTLLSLRKIEGKIVHKIRIFKNDEKAWFFEKMIVDNNFFKENP